MNIGPIHTLPLHAIAHGRAGDKGNICNISVIAYKGEAYDFIAAQVSTQKVKQLFAHLGAGQVQRFELPTFCAFNFVIEGVLDGGVNASLSLDRHGKTLSYLLLGRLILDVPAHYIPAGSPYLDPAFDWQSR